MFILALFNALRQKNRFKFCKNENGSNNNDQLQDSAMQDSSQLFSISDFLLGFVSDLSSQMCTTIEQNRDTVQRSVSSKNCNFSSFVNTVSTSDSYNPRFLLLHLSPNCLTVDCKNGGRVDQFTGNSQEGGGVWWAGHPVCHHQEWRDQDQAGNCVATLHCN